MALDFWDIEAINAEAWIAVVLVKFLARYKGLESLYILYTWLSLNCLTLDLTSSIPIDVSSSIVSSIVSAEQRELGSKKTPLCGTPAC